MLDPTSVRTPKQFLDLLVSMNSIPTSLPPIVRDLLKHGSIELTVKADTHTLWPLLATVRTSTGWRSTLSAGTTTSSGRRGPTGAVDMVVVRIRFTSGSGNAEITDYN